MTFGEKLAEARREKGLSQEELAGKIFVTRQAVSRWENNTAQPSLEMLSVLCGLLDRTPDFFLGDARRLPRDYKALTRGERRALWEERRPNDGRFGLKCFLFQMMLCAGVFLLTLTVCNCYITKLWEFPAAGRLGLLLGAALWIAAAVALSVISSLRTSACYTVWLMETHSVVRTNKFYVP